MVILREFLYLNSKLTDQFLAQLEGGLFDEETERDSQTGKRGLGGGVRASVAEVKAEKGSERKNETERVRRQTPESQFNRLYDYLGEDELMSIGDGIDDPAFASGLQRGLVLELSDVTIAVSGF
ncbi:MAG: hypothetical protein M3256_03200 [Actinomycetota bacterium]|nr:hypothetical protein [Actinomycetota bacterium]